GRLAQQGIDETGRLVDHLLAVQFPSLDSRGVALLVEQRAEHHEFEHTRNRDQQQTLREQFHAMPAANGCEIIGKAPREINETRGPRPGNDAKRTAVTEIVAAAYFPCAI